MDLEALAKAAGFELLALEDVVWGFRPPTKQELSKIAAALKIEVETLTRLAPRVDRADKRDNMYEEVIVIGGVEFKVPKAAAQAMRAENARKDSQIQELTSQRDGLQGRFDAQAQELGQLKTKVSEFDSRLDNAVVERETFLSKARKVLGADGDVTGTKRQVMERAIKHDSKDLDLTGRSDDYVESRFDALVETFDQADRADKSKDSTRRAALEATRQDGGGKRPSAEEARRKMVEANQNAWKPAGQNA
jgi:uncharacterized coiled-coil DUF342 family protein